jgi:hypothetical protein
VQYGVWHRSWSRLVGSDQRIEMTIHNTREEKKPFTLPVWAVVDKKLKMEEDNLFLFQGRFAGPESEHLGLFETWSEALKNRDE